MRIRKENRIEKDYKDIEWRVTLEGKVDVALIMYPEENADYLQYILNEVADTIIISPTDFNGDYQTIELYDGIVATLEVLGWSTLSFGAQSVLIEDIADALLNGITQGSQLIPDFHYEW